MKIILFGIPSDMDTTQLLQNINKILIKKGVKTHLLVLEKDDIGYEQTEYPSVCQILDDVVQICGTGKDVAAFNAAFWNHLSSCFDLQDFRDAKIILTEIVKNKTNPIVKEHAKQLNIPYIFQLCENALGMIR